MTHDLEMAGIGVAVAALLYAMFRLGAVLGRRHTDSTDWLKANDAKWCDDCGANTVHESDGGCVMCPLRVSGKWAGPINWGHITVADVETAVLGESRRNALGRRR